MPRLIRATLIPWTVALGLLAGCATPRMASTDPIQVEGTVTVRGNEPFTVVMLQTDQDTWYILELTPEQRRALVNPSLQRVSGSVFLGDWNGAPFARLRVEHIERIES